MISCGNSPLRSSSSATGAIRRSANSRTVRRISSCCGERAKSIGVRLRADSVGGRAASLAEKDPIDPVGSVHGGMRVGVGVGASARGRAGCAAPPRAAGGSTAAARGDRTRPVPLLVVELRHRFSVLPPRCSVMRNARVRRTVARQKFLTAADGGTLYCAPYSNATRLRLLEACHARLTSASTA